MLKHFQHLLANSAYLCIDFASWYLSYVHILLRLITASSRTQTSLRHTQAVLLLLRSVLEYLLVTFVAAVSRTLQRSPTRGQSSCIVLITMHLF